VGLKAAGHRGWLGVPTETGVAVLQPDGHHRVVERCSMGYEGVWRDVPAWLAAVEELVPVDRSRIYACGLSMGGQESLLMAGHHPDLFAAVFVFNPVVDAAAWQEDLAQTSSAELRAEGSDRLIADEVGGTPAGLPDAFRPFFDLPAGARAETEKEIADDQGQTFRIDRLIHRPDGSLDVVDFKTGGGFPESDRKQVRAYGDLLGRIIPGRAIRCFLLYWDRGQVEEVP